MTENKSRFKEAQSLTEKESVKQGDCDTCGKWDSSLVLGMCKECRVRYGVKVNP